MREPANRYFNDDQGLVADATASLRDNRFQRTFHWLHLLGVHNDYEPAADVLAEIENPPYRGRILPCQSDLSRVHRGELAANEADINHIRNCYAGELVEADRRLSLLFDELTCRRASGTIQKRP